MTDCAEVMKKYVSPEYKARCIDWAVNVAIGGEKPENIVTAAKKFYEYVYGDSE